MFSVNGSTWQVQSTNAHASNILANMNSQLQAQGLPIVTATVGNVLWFYCLAAGQEIAQLVDIPLNAAKNSFDLANCDDNQIYSLLPIAGTSLIPASYSSMYVTFTATAGGPLTVASGSHVVVSGLTNKFITQSVITIPASQSGTVFTIADSTGPITVVSGQANGLVESYANFKSVINNSPCLVGSNIETATAARARMLAGNTIGNNLNGLITALRGLPGITGANAYFNYGLGGLVLPGIAGNITIAPRTCYIVVNGQSSHIASTYWSIMNAPTQGAQVQNVVTLSNQTIPISYDYASPSPVYLKVYVQSSTISNGGYQSALYNVIAGITGAMGQVITSDYMMQQIGNFPYANIEGVLVSLDGVNFGVAVNIPCNGYPVFSAAYTTIVAQ